MSYELIWKLHASDCAKENLISMVSDLIFIVIHDHMSQTQVRLMFGSAYMTKIDYRQAQKNSSCPSTINQMRQSSERSESVSSFRSSSSTKPLINILYAVLSCTMFFQHLSLQRQLLDAYKSFNLFFTFVKLMVRLFNLSFYTA